MKYIKTDIVYDKDCILYIYLPMMHSYETMHVYIIIFRLDFFFLKNECIKYKRIVFEIEDMINLLCTINHFHETSGPFVLRTDDFSV